MFKTCLRYETVTSTVVISFETRPRCHHHGYARHSELCRVGLVRGSVQRKSRSLLHQSPAARIFTTQETQYGFSAFSVVMTPEVPKSRRNHAFISLLRRRGRCSAAPVFDQWLLPPPLPTAGGSGVHSLLKLNSSACSRVARESRFRNSRGLCSRRAAWTLNSGRLLLRNLIAPSRSLHLSSLTPTTMNPECNLSQLNFEWPSPSFFIKYWWQSWYLNSQE